tara:strand:+ start:1311 stop:1712 length:402 start_codon:yes stop_codon:yes gene_type:complete
MKLYKWRQVNSGGFFTLPALNILVEAQSAREARDYAEDRWGVSFNSSHDCQCCGFRWRDYSVDDEKRGAVPTELQTEHLADVIKELKSYTKTYYISGFGYEEKIRSGEPLPLYVSGRASPTIINGKDVTNATE